MRGEESGLNLSKSSNATKKVLKTNENSHLFLFFSDHGAPGHVMFPNTKLFADELNDTLQYMYDKQMYQEFVIFIEACESGSMFQNIDLASINAWALTATNATNPSYGTYCYPHEQINGTHMYTCLGDLFSVSWMEYLEQNEKMLQTMSLQEFYKVINERTSEKSDVMEFGS